MRILNVHIFFFSRNRKMLVNCSLHRITFSIVIFTYKDTTLDERKVKEALENVACSANGFWRGEWIYISIGCSGRHLEIEKQWRVGAR